MQEFLLFFNLVVGAITFYLLNQLLKKSPFNAFLLQFLFIAIIQALHGLLQVFFFPKDAYLFCAAPYLLIYGPHFYLTFQAIANKQLSSAKILLHFLPFLIFVGLYLYLLLASTWRAQILETYYFALYTIGMCSILVYGGWGILLSKYDQVVYLDSNQSKSRQHLMIFGTILILLSLFTFWNLYRWIVYPSLPPANYYLPLLLSLSGGVWSVFRYVVKKLKAGLSTEDWRIYKDSQALGPSLDRGPLKKQEDLLYQKSGVSEELLEEYALRLRYRLRKKVYLDPGLTLDKLAIHLKIPKHALSQVFSLKMKESFTQYINARRVAYVCKLLEKANLEYSMEELYLRSGFNSKSSFNRNFKAHMKCTPSEYRAKVLETLQKEDNQLK